MLIVCPKCFARYQIPDEVHLTSGKKLKCSCCQHVFVLREELPVNETVPPVTEVAAAADSVKSDIPLDNSEGNVFLDEPSPVFKEEMPQPFLPVVVSEPKSQVFMRRFVACLSLIVFIGVVVTGFVYRDVIFHTLVPVPENTKSVDFPSKKSVVSVPKPTQSVVQKEDSVADKYENQLSDSVVLPEIQSVRFEKRQDSVPTIRIEGILKNSHDVALRLPEKVRAIAYNHDGAVLFEKDIYLTDSVLPAGEERSFFGSYQPAPDGIQWVDVTF